MIRVSHVLKLKNTSREEATSSSEEIKPVALSIVGKIWLNRKFHNNLLEEFRETFWTYLPNQHCQTVVKKRF